MAMNVNARNLFMRSSPAQRTTLPGRRMRCALSTYCGRDCPVRPRSLCCQRPVGLLESPHCAFGIPALLGQGFRIPLAAFRSKKVASIDMNGSGQPRNRIGDGVNDVLPQGLGVPLAQRLRARGFERAHGTPRDAAPEDVVLPARIDPDHRPHLMIMRHQGHVRSSNDVENREIVRTRLRQQHPPFRLAQLLEEAAGITDGTRDDLAHQFVGLVSRKRTATIGDELIEIEHWRCPPSIFANNTTMWPADRSALRSSTP